MSLYRSELAIPELLAWFQEMQQTIQGLRLDLQQTKGEIARLKRGQKEISDSLNSSNDELDWIDKRTFVLLLTDAGLMDAARVNSPCSSADNFRYMSRLMRDWEIFATHEGSGEPSSIKQVWKLSSKKVLFHKTRAVERFRQFTRMRSSFTRTKQD